MSFGIPDYWRHQQLRVNHSKGPQVVVLNGTDAASIVQKQMKWLNKHYPGYQTIQMAVVKQNNRIYNRMTFRTANKQPKVILFDVTSIFQNGLRTTVRLSPGGTMARIWPGTTSTPTRQELLM